ncbi:hypothetical protein [Photobacterium damselae]|uniref:hypothetical protein n=1 Tax=Photobacterium damselae TaxID=38293 RepID=UPI001F291B7B|nr:hypothetical protein [Photobacterium damselae]UKA04522.1 hypothetical protein IHC89_23150 [Photobacterium damselae subsp. damselae]
MFVSQDHILLQILIKLEKRMKMNTNLDTATSFMFGCIAVDLIYLMIALWCFFRVGRVVKETSFSTFGVGRLTSILWFAVLGVIFSAALCVSVSSGYYEYKKIVNAKDQRYSVTTDAVVNSAGSVGLADRSAPVSIK